MLSDKQVKGLRQWLCDCGITLAHYNDERVVLRERGGRVVLDAVRPRSLERKCSKCGTINVLTKINGKLKPGLMAQGKFSG